jgi:PAS domain S-box-containing protein
MLRPSILIVEDEAVVAEDLAKKVTALGYRILDIASTGAAALQISQAQPPDLILLDITLTGELDGIETATRLKEFSDIPLVFLTAHSDPETVKRATAAGSLGYILKPVREGDLEVQLRAALYMSERKKTEQKLRKTEDLLLRAQRGAQAGVWEIDLRTERITWSEPYYDLVGIDRSTDPSVATWLSCIHPEDRERVLASYSQSIKEKSNQNMEYRIIKPNGDVRWVQRQGQIELDEQGTARRINGITFDITERKQADEVVKAIALFPAQNPSPVLRVSAAGILLYMNPVSDQLLQELHLRLGQPVPIVLENVVRKALEAAELQQAEYSLGSCHYLLTVTPVAEGNYANLYWTDITTRKRAEEALRDSEQRLTGLVTTAMDAIVSVDGNHRITLFNQAAEQMFGCPADQAMGQPLDRFIPDRYRQAHQGHVANFGRTGTTTRRMGRFGTVYGLRATGEEFPLEASISHLDVGGSKVFTVILRDITQRVQSEKALRESEDRMRQSAGQLEQRVAERTEELMQSERRLRALATELNLAEQRERTRLANDLHDYLAQLLVLGRLTLGRAKRLELPAQAEKLIKETEETLSEALNYCRTLMAELSPPVLQEQGLPAGLKWLSEHMKGQNLEVAVKVEDANSVMFPKDSAVLLFQSVRELLINVAKHGAVKKATVTMTHQDGSLTIVVRDENGFDLPAATAAATISPLSSKFGLFSIRERMKALGGTFVIQSERGKGTTATLTFPLQVPPKPPSQSGQA